MTNAPQIGPKKRNPNLRRDGSPKFSACVRACLADNAQAWRNMWSREEQ